jgi:hypothetical protein
MNTTGKPPAAVPAMLLAACAAVTAAIGGVGYASTPAGASVAIHFDLAGNANGWASPAWAFFAIPLVAAALALLQWLVPAIKPTAGAAERKLVAAVLVVAGIALLAGQATIVANALAHPG